MAKSNKPKDTEIAGSEEASEQSASTPATESNSEQPDPGAATEPPHVPPPVPPQDARVSAPPQPNDADRRSEARKGREPAAATKQRTEAEVLAQRLTKELEQTKQDLTRANRLIAKYEKEIGELKLAGANGARALTAQEVREKLQMNPRIEFRVLERYTHMNAVLPAHRILRGKHYPQLVAYVENGLRLVEHRG